MREFCIDSKQGQRCCSHNNCDNTPIYGLTYPDGLLSDRMHFRCVADIGELALQVGRSSSGLIRDFLTPDEQIYRDDPVAWKKAKEKSK